MLPMGATVLKVPYPKTIHTQNLEIKIILHVNRFTVKNDL